MPFLPASEFMQSNAVLLGETSYENPNDATDVITIYVTKQQA